MLPSPHRFASLLLALCALALPILAQEKEKDKDKGPLPPPDRAPHLILAHAGPHAPVRALAFAPDGATLYVGGFDKLVRRYQLVKGKFVEADAIRVPIGPGNAGVVNALAVSPDGKWVAAAGRAPMRSESWASSDDGISADFRRLTPEVKGDSGVVYLFDPTNPNAGKVIRGARSGVKALAFANPAPAGGPVLVTAGIEWNAKGDFFGVVRVFNATTGEQIASREDLPATAPPVPPGIAAWATGAKKDGLRVAVSWEPADKKAGKLFLWDDPGTPREKAQWFQDASFNSPLALRVKDGAAAEVITGGFDFGKNTGVLTVWPVGGGASVVTLAGATGEALLPSGIAALNVKGTDATAVLAQGAGAARQSELLFLTAGGTHRVALTGVTAPWWYSVLTASPDGRFVAVAGFADNRVEVYDAAALAAGRTVVEKLAGDASGFTKVAFLTGEKLWLGKPADTLEKGGVVLDLDKNARTAAPRGEKDVLKADVPAGTKTATIEKAADAEAFFRGVAKAVGAPKPVALPAGERATAVAYLPAKPAWDATLGPIVAVAQIEDRTQTVRVALYDALTAKLMIQFGGPTLALKTLVFSGTRALLAGAGDDGTVAVWSLKNATRRIPTVEGVNLADNAGAVTVVSVRDDVPAKGKLAAGNVIESVADAKGVQKALKTARDFPDTVETLKIGDNAQIKVKGNPVPVVVPVGARTAFRHPLFTLWVDPLPAKDGKHDWVGWTSSGPYDASGEGGESRIGWVTATGDPARPVTFAGANQYRKMFYKRDFIRSLLETADYNSSIARIPPPRVPGLTTALASPTEERDGRIVTREKGDALTVTLDDPDTVVDLDRAELQWQVTGPGGASEWKRESFAAGRRDLDLTKHDWKRGEHRVHVKLFKKGVDGAAETLVKEVTHAVWFVPPPPVVAVKVDGAAPKAGVAVETKNEEIEIAATAEAKTNPDGAAVTVSWPGGKPVQLKRNADGTFVPAKVQIPEGTTEILVTGTNSGADVRADAESSVVAVRVRRVTVPVPPPSVKLSVVTPSDFRATTDEPYVLSVPKATVTAGVEDKNAALEWKIGDAEWEPGQFDAGKLSQTREVLLPVAGALLKVQVRAKVPKSEAATDAAELRYDGLPDVSLKLPAPEVTAPELNLSGGLKVAGKRPFKVRVLVTSSRSGRTREFEPTPNAALTAWDAAVTLFPGDNQIGYVIKYDDDRKELRRPGLVEVRYVRPPLVAGGAPMDVGTGTVGNLALAVVGPADAAPTELQVNGSVVGFRTHATPLRVFGARLWLLEAKGAEVPAGDDRLKPLPITVRNAEVESRPLALEVRGQAPKPITPPAIRLTHKGSVITPDQGLPPVGESRFAFALKAASETPFTRIEVWRGAGANTGMELVNSVKAAGAAKLADGTFELLASPTIDLRPGTANYVRVVASNEGGTTAAAFNVSYAPPPVRVVIDTVRDLDGKPIKVSPGSTDPLQVEKSVVEIEGRVLWDFDNEPVAKDPYLSVVFVANGVAHLPVAVAVAKGEKERKFRGRVYLNTLDPKPEVKGATRIRADLRSGDRPVPIPQEGLQQATITVTSKDPLRRQRLHVLMVGVDVADADRKVLGERVVKAVGGKIPANNPNFTHGVFERKDFEFAYLYPPRLDYTKESDLNALLSAVRRDIETRSRRSEGWVNDVIVVYYQGEDWVDKDTGRWLLHSATTLSGAAGKNRAGHAIRLDNLPQTPGMPVAVVNVASIDKLGNDLSLDLPFLRYAWAGANNNASAQVLDEFGKGVLTVRTFGGIAEFVNKGLSKLVTTASSLPDEGVGGRVVGIP